MKPFPFNFDNPDELTKSLKGVDTLFCTYWIRFEHGDMTFDKAVRNTETLIRSAKEAGVRKFVYTSITNASETSPLPYFKGKGLLERRIKESGLSYAIIRPTVIFGKEDILINNIAWILRRAPMFAVPGDGEYKLQPVYVEDIAVLSVETAKKEESITIDAAGPEIYTFNQLVKLLAEVVHSRTKITHMNPRMALMLAGVVGKMVQDVILTEDEVKGLMSNLLVSEQPPTCQTLLSEWLRQNAETIGTHYASELAKHYR